MICSWDLSPEMRLETSESESLRQLKKRKQEGVLEKIL